MKRNVKIKNLIAFTLVLILLFSITVSSYAIWNPFDTQRNRAFVAAALAALNIAFESQQMSALSIVDYIADPLEVDYSYVDMWEDRPQIQIWPDYVTIDGVDYTDVWISNEAAEKFRINATDFNTAYQIASQSSGQFVSGWGSIDGLPVFEKSNGTYESQHYLYSGNGIYPFGNGTIEISGSGATRNLTWTDSLNNTYTSYFINNSQFPVQCYYYYSNSQRYIIAQNNEGRNVINVQANNTPYVHDPFDFDYVSQIIPVDEPLPADTGMMIRVPSKDPLGVPYFDDFLTDNPEFQENPVTIDVNLDPDIMNKLDDLINIVAPIIPQINNNHGDVTFIENHTQPAPVIDNLLPDTYKQEILQPITQNFQETQQTIQNMGDSIVENIPKIDEICNNIDTAPYHDLDTGLDHLPTVFLPFITDLRSALGIWHYVTEWISQISTTFAFVTGCLVGTSIMTPIYAAIAGFMCIKVYRRMTG